MTNPIDHERVDQALRALSQSRARVSPAERRGRNGHHGAVVLLRGGDEEARAELGVALERTLWERGVQSALVDGDADLLPGLVEAAHALARAGVVAIVGATRAPGARMLRAGLGWITVQGGGSERLADVVTTVVPLVLGAESDFVVEV
jgi:hypothetical protein